MGIKFAELKRPEPNTLLLVDALNLAFRYKHAKTKDFGAEYLRTAQSLANSYQAGQIIFVSDQGNSSFRKGIYPEYKQNRADKYAEQTEEERLEFQEFFKDYEKTLEMISNSGYKVFRYKNVEADDLAAYIVKNKKKFNFEKIWLVSSDKDWDLLINENTSRFSYVTRKETRLDNWHEHHECIPEHYVSLKILMGDAGDNIKGVEGIGPKRANQIIQEYGDIFDILSSVPLPGKQKFIQNLNNSTKLLEINVQLVDLLTFCDDAIGQDNITDLNTRIMK